MARRNIPFPIGFIGPEPIPRPRGVFVSADPSGAEFARHINHTDPFTGEVTDYSRDTINPSRVPWRDMASPLPTTLHPRDEDGKEK